MKFVGMLKWIKSGLKIMSALYATQFMYDLFMLSLIMVNIVLNEPMILITYCMIPFNDVINDVIFLSRLTKSQWITI